MSSIVVVGAGYVGLASAVCFAHLGHDVTAAEISPERLAQLTSGCPPFFEQGMQPLLREGLAAGRLAFVAPDRAPYETADFVFLCLPTPQGKDGAADLSAIDAAVTLAAPRLCPGAIVVEKSTVPVGTSRRIRMLLGREDVYVASNPEFLQEGSAISAFLSSERVVVGADEPWIAARVASLYSTTSGNQILTSIESAELAKYACNAFLAMKLTFVNSLSFLCDQVGADIGEVTSVMGSDSRIGSKFLTPGPGWGGSCFPKDVRALIATVEGNELDASFLTSMIEANERAFTDIATMCAAMCGGELRGRRLGVLGLTFKAGTDDIRDSPALFVVERLNRAGAEVTAYDPMIREHPAVKTALDPYSVAVDADVIIVLTEWPEFARIDLSRLAAAMTSPRILDARGVIDPLLAVRAGFEYAAPGRRNGRRQADAVTRDAAASPRNPTARQEH